jgi:monovalent cation:H+ antiporter-2, CPA2 family
MLEIPFLKEFLLILIIALFTALLFNRLKIPSIVGLLVAGILIGPAGLGIISDPKEVETIAEIGLIPLLFVVGIEFSISELKKLRKIALWGGGLQILGTSVLVAVLAFSVKLSTKEAVFLGFIVALSSTAVLVKILTDRMELDTPQGKILIGILLAQDIFVIVLMFLLPIVASQQTVFLAGLTKFGVALALIIVIFYVSQRMLPRAFHLLSNVKDREIYTIAIFIFVLGIVWLTTQAGLSIALGAFLAGIVISEQEYKHFAVAQILPYKDILSSLFFVSIGMLLDLEFFLGDLGLVLLLTLIVIVLKAVLSAATVLTMRYPARVAMVVGLGLAHLGEFSFVLAEEGHRRHFITEEHFQLIMAVTIFSLILAPFLLNAATKLGFSVQVKRPKRDEPELELSNHTIVLGYGLNGKNIAKVLKAVSLPYVVMDLNPGVVRAGKAAGHNVVFGDCAQRHALRTVGINKARICVIALSDRMASEKALALIKGINPGLKVVVRTRYIAEVSRLFDLGASKVIPEEFETSVEIFTRVLREYRIPGNVISAQIAFIRQDGYRMLRDEYAVKGAVDNYLDYLKESATDNFLIKPSSKLVSKTIKDSNIRGATGATILAIIRHNKSYTNPEPELQIEEGDVLVLIGSHAQLDSAYNYIDTQQPDKELGVT